jgi:hypothetical protein
MRKLTPPALLVAAIAGAACKPAEAPAPTGGAEPPASIPEPRADLPDEQRSPDLFGAWRIERVSAPGLQPQDRGWDMILLVGNRQVEILSQCVTIGPFDYGRRVGGSIVVTQAAPSPRPPGQAGVPPPAQCARALSPAEQALPPVLFGGGSVTRNPDGSVTIAGPAGSLLLRRPSGALANPRGQAPPPPVPPLLGAWQVVSVNGRRLPDNERAELLLRPHHLEWRSGCVNEGRVLRREANMLLPGQIDPFPVCERGRSDAERGLEELTAAPIAARVTANGRLTLQGRRVMAELAPLTR